MPGQHAGLDGANIQTFLAVEAFLQGELIKEGVAADPGGYVQIDFVQSARAGGGTSARLKIRNSSKSKAFAGSRPLGFDFIIMEVS